MGGKVYQFCGGDSNTKTTANTTEYWQIFGCLSKTASETNSQMLMRTAGTLSNLHIRVQSNTINNTCVAKIRKNGVDTGLTVTITTATTGDFVDNTNTVTIAAGDKIALATVPAGGSTGIMGMYFVRTVFTADTDTVTRLAVSRKSTETTPFQVADASSTKPLPLNGQMTLDGISEPQLKCVQQHTGSFRNLAVYVRTNPRTTTTTVKLRKNEGDATSVVSIGAGVTGWIEDTTHTDDITVGDFFNYSIVTGTGTQTLEIDYIAVDYVSIDGYGQLILSPGGSSDQPIAKSITKDLQLAGDQISKNLTTADIGAKIVGGAELEFSNLSMLIVNNMIDSISTLTFRKNNADGNQIVTIPANTIGVFSDSSHKDQGSINDLVNYRLITGTGAGGDVLFIGPISCWSFDLNASPLISTKAECDVSDMATDGEFTVNFTTTDSIERQTVWLALSA